jgi:IS5 family transposase
MVSLLYLKHAFNESDEGVVERWGETPSWQYFSGMDYFEHRLPCDATLISKFRKIIGEEGVERLLTQTIAVALNLKMITSTALQTVVVVNILVNVTSDSGIVTAENGCSIRHCGICCWYGVAHK